MIKACLLVASLIAFTGAAAAETDPAHIARRAAGQLAAAAQSLEAAGGARDRVRALTRTVQAYEEGLAALRAGMRQAARQERLLTDRLDARDEEISQLLGVLTSMGRSPAPLLLLHPTGPIGTARSGMILRDLAPEVQAEVEVLRSELAQIAALQTLQSEARTALAEGLRGAQDARTELSQAMASRTDLPTRFTENTDRMGRLLSTAETLDAFAAGLGTLALPIGAATDFESRKGALPLPVQGVLLHGYGQTDAAGISRPGQVIAAQAGALVTSPSEATIRYVGPLLDYGNVMILEPSNDTLLVLAGMGAVYGVAGEVVSAGAPLGLMGGEPPHVPEFGTENAMSSGAERSETLYMELRQGESPVDPADWFTVTNNE